MAAFKRGELTKFYCNTLFLSVHVTKHTEGIEKFIVDSRHLTTGLLE
jgi:hypothetical protein